MTGHAGAIQHDDVDAYEAALRQLPEAHSLALRLKSADAAEVVVCGYLHIEPDGLETLLRVAEENSLILHAHEHRVSPQSHAEPK